MLRSIAAATLLFGTTATHATDIRPSQMAHTFSIVCYDSATGQFGAAVQSHWFKVADVIWAEPGVGAVATQSLVDFTYGPLGLEMLRHGRSAFATLQGLLTADSNNAVRQVAIIDRTGAVATHTGTKCIAEAGHHTGKFSSCQANLMLRNTVWDAMAIAFESTKGDLAERMMSALEAAEREGGDIRGKQSAAMIVVAAKPTGMVWRDRLVDLRVDDSPEPLPELRRLLNITRAYDHMNKGDDYSALKKFDSSNYEYAEAARLNPGNLEIQFWHAVGLVTAGEVDRSLPIFHEIFKADTLWRVLIPRLVKSELLPNDEKIIQKIVRQ